MPDEYTQHTEPAREQLSGLDPALAAMGETLSAQNAEAARKRIRNTAITALAGIFGGGYLGRRMERDAAKAEDRAPRYLRSTLGGALLGGGLLGGTGYLASAGPFTGPIARSFIDARGKFLEGLMDPRRGLVDAAGAGISEFIGKVLSGEHEFTPEQQQALRQQFAIAELPTPGGWRRRTNLVRNVIHNLDVDPNRAHGQLELLRRVTPDPVIDTLAGRASAIIRTGAQRPEQRHALANIARQLEEQLPIFERATGVFDALHVMRERAGAGLMDPSELAHQLGLITGRFGSQDEEIERMRRFIQMHLSRPMVGHRPRPTDDTGSYLAAIRRRIPGR